MLFEFLQHALRIQARIGIIEPSDEPERDDIIRGAVNPAAAVFFRGERPAQGVNHLAGSNASSRNFPQFFDPLPKSLRITVLAEPEPLDQLLGERSAGPFREDDNLSLQVISRL